MPGPDSNPRTGRGISRGRSCTHAVSWNLETFLANRRRDAGPVPAFVERELRAFLDCGVLARGFLRLRCFPHIPIR